MEIKIIRIVDQKELVWERYEGCWFKGLKDGWGRWSRSDNYRFEGEWKTDKRHGKGLAIYSSGDCFEGTWHDDLRQGSGKFWLKSKKRLIQGRWNDDMMTTNIQEAFDKL